LRSHKRRSLPYNEKMKVENGNDRGGRRLKLIFQDLSPNAFDIFIYLTYLSEEYKFNLLAEVENKIAVNEAKYPVEKAKGSSRKYINL